MKKLGFRSVAVQVTILFVAVLTISQILGLGQRYLAQTKALTALEAVRIADRIVTLTALVDGTPAAERPKLLTYFKGSNLTLAWSERPWRGDIATDDESRLLQRLITSVIPGTDDDVRVGYTRADVAPEEQAALARIWSRIRSFPAPLGHVVDEFVNEPTFLVSVRLSDGSWLNMVAAYAATLDFWPLDGIAFLGVMVILVAVLSIWAIRRLTAPFGVFASAAARLGTDVNAPPIAELGPMEVRGAIHAFNEMQQRLQRFLADRTQMLAAVSHDLRTPITRLRLRTEFVDDPVQRAKALADLGEMENMIDGVLSFAKGDIRVEPSARVDLVAMLHSMCDEMADRGHRVSFDGEGRLACLCRPVSLRRCLTNLIDNAVKYGQRAEVTLEPGADEILVHIDDNGPGIAEDQREQVFRPFVRLEVSRNRDSGGTGLGLSVARSIARAHGGDVVLQDRPSGGLRATVHLPAGAALAEPAPEALASAAE